MASGQALVLFENLTVQGAALNPLPVFASARLGVLSLSPVVAFSAPVSASGTNFIHRLRGNGTMGFTNAGLAQGSAWLVQPRFIASALSGQFSPQASGLVPASINGSTVVTLGPHAQIVLPLVPLGLPTTLAAATGWTSPPIANCGYTHITLGFTSSQAGTLSLNRYVDPACTVIIGAAVTQAVVAATAVALENNDGKGFSGFTVAFSNTSASLATLSSVALLLSSG